MKKKAVLIISGLLLLSASALAGYLINKNSFRASEDFATAEISLNILENNEAASGIVLISGDCPEAELSGSDGQYYCQLTSNKPGSSTVTISSLAFFNFADDVVTPIKLSTRPTTEHDELTLPTNDSLILDVTILDGKVTVTRWNATTRLDEPFPLPDPED